MKSNVELVDPKKFNLASPLLSTTTALRNFTSNGEIALWARQLLHFEGEIRIIYIEIETIWKD